MARHIDSLFKFIQDRDRRAQLADAANTSGDYLWQIATGRRQASPELAILIEESTGGKVSRSDLRPTIWPAAPKRRKAA